MPRQTFDLDSFELPEPQEPTATPLLLHPCFKGFEARLEQWILRALIDLDGINSENTKLRTLLRKLSEIIQIDQNLGTAQEVVIALSERRQEIDQMPARVSGVFARNLDTLAHNLQLSEMELDILAFTVIYHHYSVFETIIDVSIGQTDFSQLPYYLSRITGHPLKECGGILQQDNTLMSAGLLENGRHARLSRRDFNELLTLHQRASKVLLLDGFSISDLLDSAVRLSQDTDLVPSDYDFISAQRDLVLDYMGAAKTDQIQGACILLDGPPGTGKTEFARLIAKEIGFDAFDINELDEEQEAASVAERLGYFLLAQHMMKGARRNLLIFDEADAALGSGLDLNRDRWRQSKASINRMLDTLKVPTIWITNHGGSLDPAIARRFDLTIRFHKMPTEAKKKMIEAALPESIETPQWVDQIIRHQEVTPARIEQAKRLSRLLTKDQDKDQADCFFQVLTQNLDIDQKGLFSKKSLSPLDYCPEVINANEDMGAITSAIGRVQQVRLCLYGPPGTGKTAYAHYLADQCGLKLEEYRASDLLGAFVGQTEANIREMFYACDNPETLLFLDEADSLFRSRQFATRNFEINQVNELLKGLEEYSGVFVACTNLLGELDSAVMRRFDFKIQLDYLKPNQRWGLFQELTKSLNIDLVETEHEQIREKLARLHFLTPGDFATLARRGRVLDIGSEPSALITLLEKEMSIKPDCKSSVGMGFTANIAA